MSKDPKVQADADIAKFINSKDAYFLLADTYFWGLGLAGKGVEKAYILLTAYERLANLPCHPRVSFCRAWIWYGAPLTNSYGDWGKSVDPVSI